MVNTTLTSSPVISARPQLFTLPASGDHCQRNWRGGREELWDADRLICWIMVQPEHRRPKFGHASDRGNN